MTKKKAGRLDWLVSARGWAMLGIFIGHAMIALGFDFGHHDHNHPLLKTVGRLFDPAIITFFILIIGAFYQHSPKPFSNYIKLKFTQRLLPVYFYMLLVIPFFFLLPPPGTSGIESINKIPMYLLGIPWLNWPTWFLIALFIAELIFFFLYPLAQNKTRCLILAGAFFLLGWVFNYYKFSSPTMVIFGMIWMLHSIPLFIAVFLVGAYFKKTILKMSNWSSTKTFTVMTLGFIALLIAVSLNSYPNLASDHWLTPFIPPDRISNFHGQYGNLLWFLIASIAGPITFLCFCRLAPASTLMRQCGDYSLVLIGLNGIFFNVLNRPLIGLFANQSESDLLLLLLCSIVGTLSLLVSLWLAKLLDRLFPQLLGKPMLNGPILPALYRRK